MGITIAALIAAAALGLVLIRGLRRRIHSPADSPQVRLFGSYSPVLTWVAFRLLPPFQQAAAPLLRRASRLQVGPCLELAVVLGWALWVGRSLLNFDPQVWPIGREFGFQIYGFHFWEQLRQCGLCALWNGMFNGGTPSLADPFTGVLHPISALAGSLAQAANAAKITVVASIWMAGVAQWYMGRAIGLGRWSRLWTALVAVSGGHILGRMELGAVALVLSTAASSLALAGAVDLAVNATPRAALRLAVFFGLAILSGHAYLQVALLLWSPAIALIAMRTPADRDRPWRGFLLAIGLAALIASAFLIPFLHIWPHLDKFVDPGFATSQPFEYIPLNLVIHDWDYYLGGQLGTTPYPYLHMLYIGWPAVLLAGFGLARTQPAHRRLLGGLSLGTATMFWLASGTPFRWISAVLPSVADVRHAVLIAGMAVPALLLIAGYGFDRFVEVAPSLGRFEMVVNDPRAKVSLRLSYLLSLPLIAALLAADRLGQNFLQTESFSGAYQAIGVLRTPDLQWVAAPFGEHYWVEPALSAGLKLTNVVTPYWWAYRELPPPLLQASRDDPPADLPVVGRLDDIPVYQMPEGDYARVVTDSEDASCSASGTGGDLLVRCDSAGGTLVVHENAWTGWAVEVNGTRADLHDGQWLSVDVPSGHVEARFRYRPLDALVGALLTLAGIVATVVLWLRTGRPPGLARASSESRAGQSEAPRRAPGGGSEPTAPASRATAPRRGRAGKQTRR